MWGGCHRANFGELTQSPVKESEKRGGQEVVKMSGFLGVMQVM